MTPAQIDKYLRERGSPLAGRGATFVREGRKNGVDPLLLVAIAGAETEFGTYGPSQKIRNPFGWGPHIQFPSWDAAIATVAKGLRKGYLDEGLKTISQIGAKWAPAGAANGPTNLNSNWAKNVGRFYTDLGGQGVAAAAPKPAPIAAQALGDGMLPTSPADLSGLALSNLAAIAGGGKKPSPFDMLSGLTNAVAAQPELAAPPAAPVPPSSTGAPVPQGTSWQQWVGDIEKRQGPSEPHKPAILQFVGRIGQMAGQVLTPWGNESHSLTTVNGTPSAHAHGWAVDVPSSGKALTRLGQTALIAAGADPVWARKQTGGLFNIGGYQIIFNTNTGGNHYDHLHVGIRGRK
jgi:hypothetical protein